MARENLENTIRPAVAVEFRLKGNLTFATVAAPDGTVKVTRVRGGFLQRPVGYGLTHTPRTGEPRSIPPQRGQTVEGALNAARETLGVLPNPNDTALVHGKKALRRGVPALSVTDAKLTTTRKGRLLPGGKTAREVGLVVGEEYGVLGREALPSSHNSPQDAIKSMAKELAVLSDNTVVRRSSLR